MPLYAFDGTWNRRDGKEVIDHVQRPNPGGRAPFADTIETNVHRMCEFYRSDAAVHLEGVGTRLTRFGGKFIGGAFGLGGRYRIRKMYRALCQRYHGGDRCIDLIGFSRGGALAIHFSNLIYRHGIRHPDNKKRLIGYTRDFGWAFRFPKPNPARDAREPLIHFLGLFDTVATFGWPIGPLRNASRVWRVWSIPPNVDHAFHAMALDEMRRTFTLVRPTMEAPPGATPEQTAARQAALYEMWFRGAHSNIGGGYLDRGLSDIALAWMMSQATWTWRRQRRPRPYGFRQALRVLEPNASFPTWSGTTRELIRPNPAGAMGRPRKVPNRPAWRDVPPGANVHHSANMRERNLVGDHYNLNRPLLRIMPGDSIESFDPPVVLAATERDIAHRLAGQLFNRIPVDTRDWLRLGSDANGFIYRGGPATREWVAQGTRRGRSGPTECGMLREDFTAVATGWLLSGGDLSGAQREFLADGQRDTHGFADSEAAIDWVVAILDVMWQVTPRMPEAGFLFERLERTRH